MAKDTTTRAESRGLFDDFGAFRTPTADDFTAVLTGGLVTPDANVLLNLYRYTEQARGDLLRALGGLENRLWVPHQALVEFWRNREGTLSDARSSGTRAADEMASHAAQADRTFLEFSLQVGSVEDIERVERIGTEEKYGGWTADALRELFALLRYEGYEDRVAVIRHAAAKNGVADAKSVYNICGYDPDRTLKHFTTPVNRITVGLRGLGLISESAVRVLTTEYGPGQGHASGFSVHPLLVPLINEQADDDE
ncbi:PIN-like domain-containing protein [Streptomyces sp. NPDC056716]|uniref:PIN-like domain-containing protein n=1 Tax=unclassified Streptomyces TaxID=2593676 RepID=UPI003686C80B